MSDDIHALSGAYAVDALDDVERERFERHLAECSTCRAEVAELAAAAAELAVLTELAPPAGLRTSVMAEVAKVRPLPPLPGSNEAIQRASVTAAREAVRREEGPGADTAGSDTETDAGSAVDEDVVVRVPFRTRRPTLWRGLVAASAAVLLALGGFVAWRAATYDANQAAADKVLAAPDATRQSKRFPDGSTATIVRSPELHKAVLVTSGLATPPKGKVYQLWLRAPDGHMAPAGLMPPGSDQVFVLTGDASTATGAGITVEPAGGSDQPTSNPIALFPFA